MSIPSSNPQTYGWIKPALMQSMSQIMESLESIDSDANSAALNDVSVNLHQIQGSLQMVELNAASILARDMESLSIQISDDAISEGRDDASALIKSGLLRLQSYLDSIEKQSPLSPLTLLKEINAVRKAGGKEPLTSYDLFDPPLGLHPAIVSGDSVGLPGEQRRRILTHLRKRYRQALLVWLKNVNSDESLETITQLLSNLRRVSDLDVFQQLWWIAAGFVEAVKEGDSDIASEIKAQFAKLDAEMSRIEEDNPAAIASSPPDELMRKMLYFIGSTKIAPDSSESVNQIKAFLKLDQWFDSAEELEQQSEYTDIAKAIAQFAEKLGPQFVQKIENYLDLYFSDRLDDEQVARFFEDISYLENSSKEIDVGQLGSFIATLCDAIRKVDTDPINLAQTAADVKVATSVLLLRDTLNDPAIVSEQWLESVVQRESELNQLIGNERNLDDEAVGRQQAAMEYAEAKSAVLNEVNTYLDRIEYLISENAGSDENGSKEIENRLFEIAVWFAVLEIHQASRLAENTARVMFDFRAEQVSISESDKERIAFVIASIGVCSEQLEISNFQIGGIVERAQEMLDSINIEEESQTIETAGAEEAIHESAVTNISDITPAEKSKQSELSIDEELELMGGGEDESASEGFVNTKEIVSEIDQLRKKLGDNDEEEIDLLRLTLMFSALEDNVEDHDNEHTLGLARVGKNLSSDLIEGESKFNGDVADFLGRLVRQIRQIEVQGGEFTGTIEEWESQYEILKTSPADTDGTIGIAIEDAELREIFVEELLRHADVLNNSSMKIKSVVSDKEYSHEVVEQEYSTIRRTIHTLVGNFRNTGIGQVGDDLEHLEELFGAVDDEGEFIDSYCNNLIVLGSIVRDTATEFENDNSLSMETASKYTEVANNFRQLGLEKTKKTIPFLDDVLELDDKVSGEENYGIAELSDHHDSGEEIDRDDNPVLDELEIVSETNEITDGKYQEQENVDDLELRDIFLEESGTLLGRINNDLTKWRNSGISEEILGSIRREFHTLKGSAAATNYEDISNLSHAVESLLESDEEMLKADDSSLLNLMEEIHDGVAADLGFIPGKSDGHVQTLTNMVGALLERDDETISNNAGGMDILLDDDKVEELTHDLEKVSQVLYDEQNTAVDLNEHTETQERDTESNDTESVQHLSEQIENSPTDSAVSSVQEEPMKAVEAVSLRIDSKKISDLLNYSGELGLTRTQLKNALEGTRRELASLRSTMKNIKDGLRDLEFEADAQMRAQPERDEHTFGDDTFDPLQLDRYSKLQAKARDINQQLDGLTRVERHLNDRASELDGALIQQAHLGEQLQDGLMSARMIAVNDYAPRLRQLVRETARRAGKPTIFVIQGGEIEVDRQVIETMMPPFEHMIRNAVVHGIEESELRSQNGKNPEGEITLKVVQQGAELMIDFGDDGAGLDIDKILKGARETGFIEDGAELTNDEILQIITQPGFSTSDKLSMQSGRGVGMDVVHQAVRSLGGSIALLQADKQGTMFQFRLPVTMTVSQALLVRVGTYRFAILSRTIDRVMRVRNEEVMQDQEERYILLDDLQIPVIGLVDRLGETSMSTDEAYRSLVLIRIADRIAAFEVDKFEDTVEIVTKVAGSQLTSIAGVNGVTILADTSIVLVLDPGQFIERNWIPASTAEKQGDLKNDENGAEDDALDAIPDLHKVLIVDDSLVVRKVMQRDLEGMGLEVINAIDGVDALEKLDTDSVDVALVDLEMPRMNGYELLVQLRERPELENLPVIVITSRSGEMHKDRALGLGADGYITKPYDLDNLSELMNSVVLNRATKH